MTRVLFGVFLLLHAMIHLGWTSPKPDDPKYPFITTQSRLLPSLSAQTLGPLATALVVLIVVAYGAAALGLFGVPFLSGIWGAAAIAGSVVSLIACAVFWHPWFVAGPVIDVAIIAAVILGWPVSST